MEQIEFKLKVPPNEVKNLLEPLLEEYQGISRFSIEKKWKKDFWGKVDNHYFRMRRKSRSRGYTNSYAPWLGGAIRKTEYGSLIKIWFDIDKEITLFDKIFDVVLYVFTFFLGIPTLIILLGSIYNLVKGQFVLSNILDGSFITIIVFLIVTWGGRYMIKHLGSSLGEDDKADMINVLENLFSKVEIKPDEVVKTI